MNILEELKSILTELNVPVETGVFSNKAPSTYIVLVPIDDTYPLSGDDKPLIDQNEVRISIYTKGNYIALKNQILDKLLLSDFTITTRRFGGYESGTGYFQYTIDVAKIYDIEEEN